MSDDKIKTKKKEKSTWAALGKAALGVASVVAVVAKVMNGNNKG